VDLKMEQGMYSDVPDLVNTALESVLDPEEKKTFGYEAGIELLDCVLAAVNQLPYADALALAGKMDREIAGLPFPVSGFAQRAARTRRRLAGDFAATLREDSEIVEQARAAGEVHSEIEGLRVLAADYRALNNVSNQIAVLESAETAERKLLPASGIPQGYPSTYSWTYTLTDLAIAYTFVKPFGPTERNKATHLLDEAIAAIDAQPAAADRGRLASARTEIELERATVLALTNRRDDALQILTAALQVEGRDKADLYLRMARVDRDTYPDRAALNYDLAIDQFTAQRQILRLAAVRVEAARVAALHGQTERAQKLLASAATGLGTAGFADTEWKLAYIGGMVLQARGMPQQAAESYLNATAKLDVLRSGLGQDQQRAFADSDWISDLYSRLLAVLSAQGRTQDAWQSAERAKARSFVDSLQGRHFKEDVPPEFQKELAALQQQMMELRLKLAPESSLAHKDTDPSPEALQNQLGDLETQFALVRDRAGLPRSRAGQAIATQPLALADLQAKLKAIDKGALIVEFATLPDGLSAFLIGPSYFEQIVWKTDMTALAQDVRTLRGLLSDRDSGDELAPVAARVAESVWKPLAAKLPPGTQRILIAPASFLNYIPFQVLPAANGKQLIDQFVISYLPSASTLALLGPPGAPGGNVFLGALGSLAVDGMPPLQATLGEVDGIRRLLPKATIAKEMDLTHDTVLAALQERDLVHLATHGVYVPAAPLFSALLLSPARNQASRLSLYELTDVQVKAKLVVLSACDSGIGKLMEGDEIAGLTRTFLSAGARTVVSSLWTVDDASTALLMQEFYRQLGKGLPPAAALRSGALAVRKQYPNPMFWAPFVLTGLP
jgi:CHAT domain-containing protein